MGMTALAGAALGSAVIGAGASSSAANTEANAANNSTQLQYQMWQRAMQNLSPYMGMGAGAGSTLAGMLKPGGQLMQSFTPADYLANKDPGYDFQLQQGQKALQASQAATNGVLSGSSLRDLIGYNQGMAATGYQNAFDRWNTQQNNVYSRLMGMTQLGENAAAGAGSMGLQAGQSMSNSMMAGANASAMGTMGIANALSGGLNNAAGYYYLNGLLGKSGTMPVSGMDPYGYGGGQDLIAQMFGGS